MRAMEPRPGWGSMLCIVLPGPRLYRMATSERHGWYWQGSRALNSIFCAIRKETDICRPRLDKVY